MTVPRSVFVSVVSHLQGELIAPLFRDLDSWCGSRIKVRLTINVPEPLPFRATDFSFPVQTRRNVSKRGFGANHNSAFVHCDLPYFCVMNPDVRLVADPFPALAARLSEAGAGVVAPVVTDASGRLEDSFRKFPTPWSLALKAAVNPCGPDYAVGAAPVEPDWVAGMFMLFRSDTFAAIGGFDERYYLYYEDVDLCARLRAIGRAVVVDPRVSVVHLAQRASRRRLDHALWHARSMARFFLSDPSRRLAPLPHGHAREPER